MSWTITSTRTCLAACLAAACAIAAPAAAAVSDFRLPPAPSEQQPPPDRQGPVAPDVPESRARPTPSPTATTPARPAIVLPPLLVPPAADDAPAPRAARTPQAPAARPGDVPLAAATDSTPPAAQAMSEPGSPAFSTAPASALSPAGPAPSAGEDEGGLWWLWALLGLAAVGVLAFAGWSWRQRQRLGIPLGVTEIERPRLTPAASPTPPGGEPAPALAAEAAEPLQVTLEPLRLSLTLMNATLAYRLEVANRGDAPVEALHIGADMIAAHASMTREEQLSGPARAAAMVQRIERLEPGESCIVEGEFRLPFPQIVPIRQGKAALLLPLARFRLEAKGAAPVVRTFVVGQPGTAAGLQPFRLDLGPRVYPKLAQRAFA